MQLEGFGYCLSRFRPHSKGVALEVPITAMSRMWLNGARLGVEKWGAQFRRLNPETVKAGAGAKRTKVEARAPHQSWELTGCDYGGRKSLK